MPMSRKLILWIVASFVVLGAMLWGISRLWESNADGLSGHGWVAYVLGGVLTLGLSIGLFLLTFHSARHGYDDIERPEDTTERNVEYRQ